MEFQLSVIESVKIHMIKEADISTTIGSWIPGLNSSQSEQPDEIDRPGHDSHQGMEPFTWPGHEVMV
jgi:hypothetical protein